METKSLNCSVFFNPNTGILTVNSHPKCLKPELKTRVKTTNGCSSGSGELVAITYMPQEFQLLNCENETIPSKNDLTQKGGKPVCKSLVEIEGFISPTNKSQGGRLKMNYILHGNLKCKTCLELKQALDLTVQKFHNMAQTKAKTLKMEEPVNKEEKICIREIRRRCNFRKRCRNSQSLDRSHAGVTKTYINDLEDVTPLAEFFARLIRNATISKMKIFSKELEEKLTNREIAALHRKDSGKGKCCVENPKEMDKRKKCKRGVHKGSTCDACVRLQQSMYSIISKLYETAGVKTDFPTVHKLETYAFLVCPNRMKFPPCKKQSDSQSRYSFSFFKTKAEPAKDQDLPFLLNRLKEKKRQEDFNEEETRKLLRARVKRHKAVFNASKFVHILTALAVSLSTIVLISMDCMIAEQTYSPKVFGVLIVLFFGCMYNLYLMFVLHVFSFKNYFIIPVCWVILTLTNGKCADPLVPDYVCDSKIHFMSHIYLFIVFLEYYLASGIHAVLVLEINQFRRLPRNDLLKYALFNLPLMIIVLIYFAFEFIVSLFKGVKEYIMEKIHNIL